MSTKRRDAPGAAALYCVPCPSNPPGRTVHDRHNPGNCHRRAGGRGARRCRDDPEYRDERSPKGGQREEWFLSVPQRSGGRVRADDREGRLREIPTFRDHPLARSGQAWAGATPARMASRWSNARARMFQASQLAALVVPLLLAHACNPAVRLRCHCALRVGTRANTSIGTCALALAVPGGAGGRRLRRASAD